VRDAWVTVRRLLRAPQRAARACREGLQSRSLLAWLAGRYGPRRLLEWRGALYPVEVAAAGGLRLEPVAASRVEPAERLVSPLYVRWGAASHDGPVLRQLSLEGDRLVVARGSYFDVLDTSDAMEWELLGALGELVSGGKRPSFRELESRLALRRAVESGEVGMAAGLGVSLVVRRRQGDGWRVLAARRAASKVSFRSRKLHVVPAGMLMPGRSVRQTALQELLEELLGMEEREGGISREPEYRRVVRSGAEFAVTGLATNLLNQRGDVCATLTIEDEAWWAREPGWRLNQEHGGGLVSIDGAPPWWDIVPQAAGALALAGV
jgi:hypothetical protein